MQLQATFASVGHPALSSAGNLRYDKIPRKPRQRVNHRRPTGSTRSRPKAATNSANIHPKPTDGRGAPAQRYRPAFPMAKVTHTTTHPQRPAERNHRRDLLSSRTLRCRTAHIKDRCGNSSRSGRALGTVGCSARVGGQPHAQRSARQNIVDIPKSTKVADARPGSIPRRHGARVRLRTFSLVLSRPRPHQPGGCAP